MTCRTSALLLLLLASPMFGQPFSPTGSLAAARDDHTATLLPNGKVLIAGGFSLDPVSHGIGYLASAELYDPATGDFTATGSLATGRAGHTATLLPNGKVLITGGINFNVPTGFVRSAELYDPATGHFSPAGDFAFGRRDHTATLLQNGKVLIAGGFGSISTTQTGFIGPAELYDPAAGTIVSSGNLAAARDLHTATLLPNGKVLIAGGGNCSGPACSSGALALTSAELYDAATGLFTPTGSLATARNRHTATLLQNGKVLVTGGKGIDERAFSPAVGPAELYDPASGTFSPTGTLNVLRLSHTATLLPNGNVLIAGGNNPNASTGVLASAELYDAVAGSFSVIGSLVAGRELHTATLLPNGKVLIAGGVGFDDVQTAELYDPLFVAANPPSPFLAIGPLVNGRYGHTATLLQNGRVLLTGGINVNKGILASAELYDPATGNFLPTGSLTAARYLHTATLLPNGRVLITGSFTEDGGSLASAELYDPASGTFSPTGSLAAARDTHTATLLPNGKVLVAGGASFDGRALDSVELFDPATATFSANGNLVTARDSHTETLLLNGKVLIAGGHNSDSESLASAEIYDPLRRRRAVGH
jgi:Galactose oxidase, central domain/Kelch motif